MRSVIATSIVLAGLCVAAGPAEAQRATHFVCEFGTPSDGFIALRREPSRGAPIVVRMSPDGFFLHVVRNGQAVTRGDWLYVIYAAPEMIGDDSRIESSGPRGWMHRSLSLGCDR